MSLLFVNDKFIKSLNRKYFKRNSATDVIAFPLERGLENKNALLGDVVISTETVARNARFYGNTPQQELAFCLIHGILHLLGYNDYNKRAKKDMFKRQEKILNLITD